MEAYALAVEHDQEIDAFYFPGGLLFWKGAKTVQITTRDYFYFETRGKTEEERERGRLALFGSGLYFSHTINKKTRRASR